MEKRGTIRIQTLIAEYLTQLADWRRMRYQDDLRDTRNLRSAEGIEAPAAYIRALPENDARMTELNRLWRRGEHVEVGQQAAYEIGRFRFFLPETELDAFLDEVVDLARSDANEHGQFGGAQAPGDNPWG